MNLLILASHGQLAQGMKQTLQMIIGEVDNLHAFSAFRDDDQSIKEKVQQLIEENTEKDIYKSLQDYSIMITDYSSIGYDFLIGLKPVIYLAFSEAKNATV